jgi:hypothetical protein
VSNVTGENFFVRESDRATVCSTENIRKNKYKPVIQALNDMLIFLKRNPYAESSIPSGCISCCPDQANAG